MELMDDLERRLEEGAAREEALSVKVVELEVSSFPRAHLPTMN